MEYDLDGKGIAIITNGYLNKLYIKPEYRNNGYATIFLEEKINEGVLKTLSVNVLNTIAIRLYSSMGFVVKSMDNNHLNMELDIQNVNRYLNSK